MAQAGEPRWKIARDWASFVLAIFAVGLSTLTYVTNFRELVELKAVIGAAPFLFYNPTDERFRVEGSVSALFINSGNRPISVISATVVLVSQAL